MNDQDLDALLGSGSAAAPSTSKPGTPAAPAQAGLPQPGAALPSDAQLDRLLNDGQAKDHITGEDIPHAFSGNSPETAMNSQSPVTALDRFNLSLGNEAGNISYLKKRFSNVTQVPGSKELAVQKDGVWYKVDPDNGGGADPWKLAKAYASTVKSAFQNQMFPGKQSQDQLMGDMKNAGKLTAEIPGQVARSAASYAADPKELIHDAGSLLGNAPGIAAAAGADMLTGGMSAPVSAGIAGAAQSLARTSLGRIVGTYQATPEEQLKDTAFETILNIAGHKILAGVKPTPGKVADTLPSIAEAFQDTKPGAIENAAKAGFKKVFAGMSVGVDNFDTMLEHPYKTQSLMKSVQEKTGSSVDSYHDEIVRQQVENAKTIATGARTTLSKIYGKMRDNILEKVPENFSANFDAPIKSTYSDAITKGLGKLVIGSGESAKDLAGADAAEYIAKNGLKNAEFKMYSPAELSSAVRRGSPLGTEAGYLSSDQNAHSIVSDFYDSLGQFANASERSGKTAAKELLDFKKLAADKAYALANSSEAKDIPQIKALLNGARVGIDNSIHDGLKDAGVAGAFREMNSTYSNLKTAFAPLEQANNQAHKSQSDKVYESLLNQFTARPGKQVNSKFAIDAAIDAAEEHGLGGLAKQLSNQKTMIQVGQAARAFNPLPSAAGKSLMAGATGALMSGHAGVAAGMAGAAAARSPMLAKAGVALAQGAFKTQQFLAKQGVGDLKQILNSPEMLNALTTGVIQSPMIRGQTEDVLRQAVMGSAQQQQQLQSQPQPQEGGQ